MRIFTNARTMAIAGVLAVAGAAQAQTFDFVSSFGITNGNPNGEWTYGYTTSLAGTYNAFTNGEDLGGGIVAWYSPPLSGDKTPSVYRNGSGNTVNGVADGEVAVHSGPSGEYGVVRFTAPTASQFSITGAFGAGDIGNVDLYVLKNGVAIFTAESAVLTESFNLNETLAVGDTIDFVVGYDGDYRFDSTPLSATLTAVPEPATMAVLGIGVLAALKRRKKS